MTLIDVDFMTRSPARPVARSRRLPAAAFTVAASLLVSPLGSAVTSTVASPGANPGSKGAAFDIQFFGDLFIPERSLKTTGSSAADPKLFAGVRRVLASSALNIANFEGAITPSHQPHTLKTYLLPMPATVAPLLRTARIDGVTLANNHALDYGLPGLIATLSELEKAQIPATGAGLNLAGALRPMVFATNKGNFCVFSLSKTYPEEFWATPASFGTASPTVRQMMAEIRSARPICPKIFVAFHWGAEGRKTAKAYQRLLARRAIDAGAAAVIGHHPHVLQPVEIYKGRPIVYSLGNFMFGTLPLSSKPEGMAAGLRWRKDGRTELWLTPLRVDNKLVAFTTTALSADHLAAGEDDPTARLVATLTNCQRVIGARSGIIRWRCIF